MGKKYLQEIEILRGATMLGIVLIHVLNTPLGNLTGKPGYAFFYFWQALLNFAVPCFIFISAVMAAYYYQPGDFRAGKYYIKKFLKIGVPFWLWTIFYLLLKLAIGTLNPSAFFSVTNWFSWLFLGKAYPHLYFMSIIWQFYILVPLLLPLVYKIKGSPLMAIGIALAGQIAFYWLNRLYIYDIFPYTATIYLRYWAIGFIGLYAGINYQLFTELLRRRGIFFTIGGALCLSIYLYYVNLIYCKQNFDTFFYTLSWNGFVILASITFLYLIMLCWREKPTDPVGKYLGWVGKTSFGIYLIHPVFTLLMNNFIHTANMALLLFITLAGLLVITTISGIIMELLKKNKITAVLWGQSRPR